MHQPYFYTIHFETHSFVMSFILFDCCSLQRQSSYVHEWKLVLQNYALDSKICSFNDGQQKRLKLFFRDFHIHYI